jgi:hypothetical protein
MCPRFVYLLVVSVFSWARLAGRQGAWKEAEIMLLRHRFGVLQRQQARRRRLTWAEWPLIAALGRCDLGGRDLTTSGFPASTAPSWPGECR